MNDADPWTINLQSVRKVYRGGIETLRGIEMRVRGGEIFGLLGPNGAGKSTLVKIMMTVIRPTTAAGTILNKPIGDKGTLARVGYLPENHRFPRYLTGRQVLELFGALAGVDRETRRRRASELLDIVGMTKSADRRINTYSKGMMQRIGLGQAVMNDPDLIVLDEPTDGVDPVGRREIRNVLLDLRRQGKTIFINSHLLGELELMCDRVAILLRGVVIKQGTVDELAAGKGSYEIELATKVPDAATVWRALGLSGGTLASGQQVTMTGSTISVSTSDADAIQPVIDKLRAAGWVVRRVEAVRPSLEELFIDAVRLEGDHP